MSKIQAMRRRGVLLAAVTAASVAGSWTQLAPAAPVTWNGGGLDDFWTTPLNWNGGVAPVAGDSLIFDGFGRLTTNNNNFPASTAFAGITFATSAGAFTLSGNSISLTGNLADNTAVLTQVVNNNLIVGATRDVSVASTGTLRLGGVVSGAGGLHKLGDGTLILGGANTFTGGIDIGAGRVQISADNNLGAAPGAATPNQLIIDGIGGTLQSTANLTLNANRGIALGPAGSAGTGVIAVDSGTTLTYGGIMTDNAGGTGGLVKTNFGTLNLFGANTYSGATQVKNGTLALNFANAAVTTPINNIINPNSNLRLGGLTAGLGQANHSTLQVTGKANTANVQSFNGTHIDIYAAIIQATNGSGTGTATVNLGALTHTPGGSLIVPTQSGIVNTTTSVAGTRGILGGWAIAGTSATSDGILRATDYATVDGTGKIVPYTGYVSLPVYDGTAANTIAGNAAISSNADKNLRFVGTAASELRVDAENAGTTTNINTLAYQTGAGLNHTLVIGKGNTLRFGVNGGMFKQNTDNNQLSIGGTGGQLAASLDANAGNITAGGPNADTPGELVITLNGTNNNNGGATIASNIVDNGTGAVTVVKNGTISLKVNGHNTYTGGTYITQGRFQLAGSETNRVVDPADPTPLTPSLPLLSAGNPDGLGSGPVTVVPGAYLFISGVNGSAVYNGPNKFTGALANTAQNAPIANPMFLAGSGTTREPIGAIRLGGKSILTGTITLAGDARIGGSSNNGNHALTYDTYPALNNDNTTLYIDPSHEISGKITGPYAFDVGSNVSISTNFKISNPANDWAGDTTFVSGGGQTTLRLGANEVIPHGTGKGNLVWGPLVTTNIARLDMQGYSETINGLSTTTTNLASVFIENTGVSMSVVAAPTETRPDFKDYAFTANTSTLTVGGFDQSATFGGTIRDTDTARVITLPNPNYALVDHDSDPNTPPIDPEGDLPTTQYTAPWVAAGAKVALTKTGAGIQTLSGNNTYTGATNVNGGVLAVNGSIAATGTANVTGAGASIAGTGSVGNIVATAGGAVSPGGSGVGSIGNLTAASLNMNNGKLLIDFGGGADQLNLTGSATFTGSNVIQPSGSAVTGTYTVLNATGGITGGGTLSIGAFPFIPDSRPASAIVIPSANKIDVQVTGAKNLTWTGNTNANWELGAGGSLNWVDPVPTNERFFNADTTRFGNGPTNRNITLAVNVLPGLVTFSNSAGNDYVISGSGSIGGLSGVVMEGAGNATIATNNNFTGQIHASNGRLTMSGSNTPGSVLVDGGILEVVGNMTSSSNSLIAGELHIGNGGTSGNLTGPVANGTIVKFNRTDSFTFASNITGTGRVQQIGGGTVTVSGNNTYTGETGILNGVLNVTSFTAAGGPNADVSVSNGGSLDLAGIPTANAATGFGTNKNIHFSGTGVAGLPGSAAITNSGTLSQQNAFQRLILDADGTIGGTGRFDLRGGTGGPSLSLNGHVLTKIGTNQFSVVSGIISAGDIVVNDGFFQIESASSVIEGGSITVNGPGTLRFHQLGNGGGDGVSIPINLNDGSTLSDNNQTHVSTISSPVTLTGNTTFNIQQSTGFTFTGDIGGTGGMTKAGGGLMIVNGANNNFAGTLGASGGKIRLDSNVPNSSGLSVSGTGTIELSSDGSFNKFIRTGPITVAGTGKVDLKDNKLFSSAPAGTATGGIYDGVQGAVQSASNFGAWDGPGLTTSMPDAIAGLTTIGIATGEQIRGLGPTDTDTFGGQVITGATTIAMYTYAGDANLDGTIDGGDYGIIDNFAQIPGADGYANGDFNYDSVIDGGDYGIIDNNAQAQGAPFPTSGAVAGASLSGVTAVPEPASLSVLGLGAVALLGRRRRRGSSSDDATA